jgi:alpha-tubulin suppressor-like RCC1 family protein
MRNKRFFGIMIIFFLLITLSACSRSNDSPSTVVTAISAGNLHTVALKNDGTVWAWGYNGFGELGDGTSTDRYTPVPAGGSLLTGVIAISAGGYRTVALKNDGTVWDWGYNLHGELGDGTGTNTNRNTPVQVEGMTGITAISAGNLHTVALKNDGTFWAWGNNDYGQLGDGTNTDRNIPVQVSGLT